LHEKDKAQTGFLVEAWPCGLVIEIGAVAQNFYAPKIIDRFLIILSSLREEIDKLKNKLIELPNELVVHVHQGSIDYPRDEKGNIDGLIHPERINQDWKMIKKGDSLFLDSQGIIHKYDGDQPIWPVFIGEVAYKEKKIAMSYTKKEVIRSKNQWVQEFESL
jgi:aspartoacylase